MSTEQSPEVSNLLDLPADILTEIVRQLARCTDLTAVALTHSSLHKIAVPFIYTRFSIWWPDSSDIGHGPSGGVDSLSHGLATLVLSQELFGEGQESQMHSQTTTSAPTDLQIRRRRGNYFASYISTFELGNGPSRDIRTFDIHRDRGRMLGSLVAVALPRMHNLANFIWDMPTGIHSDVWNSLAYLGDRKDGRPCRLENVTVRCPSNPPNPSAPVPPPMDVQNNVYTIDQTNALARVVFPSYSQLPPLRSLCVIDIEEMQYLDEMSVLIGKSLTKLRHLCVGISKRCKFDDWAQVWLGDGYVQIDPFDPIRSTATIGGLRLEGILGVLTSAFHTVIPESSNGDPNNETVVKQRGLDYSGGDAEDAARETTMDNQTPQDSTQSGHPQACKNPASPSGNNESQMPRRLRLESLSLQLVTLSLPVMLDALDWSVLTSLTLLDCARQDSLWRSLHAEYANDMWAHKRRSRMGAPSEEDSRSSDARLKLRCIHLERVTPAFVRFAHDCLAPNTLELLFLQEIGSIPTVTLDDIFNGIVKRHRSSLKYLLLDSGPRKQNGKVGRGRSWQKWAISSKHVRFITSGKMPKLEELGASIQAYRNWYHYYLRRMPALTRLRAIYIPRYDTRLNSDNASPRDIAGHILEVLERNPAMRLTYIGVTDRCYEVTEGDAPTIGRPMNNDPHNDPSDDEEDDSDDTDDDTADANSDDDRHDRSRPPNPNYTNSDGETAGYDFTPSEADSDLESVASDSPRLRLRGIYFDEHEVAIFRARKGRL